MSFERAFRPDIRRGVVRYEEVAGKRKRHVRVKRGPVLNHERLDVGEVQGIPEAGLVRAAYEVDRYRPPGLQPEALSVDEIQVARAAAGTVATRVSYGSLYLRVRKVPVAFRLAVLRRDLPQRNETLNGQYRHASPL